MHFEEPEKPVESQYRPVSEVPSHEDIQVKMAEIMRANRPSVNEEVGEVTIIMMMMMTMRMMMTLSEVVYLYLSLR